MRSLVFALVLAAVLFAAAPGFCQMMGGLGNLQLGIGSLNGPTAEIRSNQWMVQGSWNMYYLDDAGFDDAFVLRADYIWNTARNKKGMVSQKGQPPAEIAFGYTYISLEDDTGNSFSEHGANVQLIYFVQPKISLRAGYDYFFEPDPGSIQSLVSLGAIFHF